MSTFNVRRASSLPVYDGDAGNVRVIGVRKDNNETVQVDQAAVILEAFLKTSKPYYGICQKNWRSSLSQTLEAVNPELMTPAAQPWWERIRSFVENPDGTVKYYLDKNDSRYKEGGTVPADLTGKDGNVMVEIPGHYLRVEYRDGDRYRLYSDFELPGFTYIPRMVISKFMASKYTGSTVANSALVQNGMVSNCLLKWDSMAYMQTQSGDESPILRHIVKADNISYRTPYFGQFDSTIEGNEGLVADADWHTLAEACRGGNVTGTTLDETYHSELGMCRTGMTRTDFRTACNAVNTAHSISASDKRLHIGSFHVLNELAWGARCKYLNYDIQNVAEFGEGSTEKLTSSEWSTWGGGQYEPFIPNGVTAPLGDNTGYVTYKLEMADGTEKTIKCGCLFGVELPIAYIWANCDDLLCYNDGSTFKAYWCDDPAHYFTPADSGAESLGQSNGYALIATLPLGSTDYIDRESMAENGLSLPMSVGGTGTGATAGVGDYYYQPGASALGWFAALLGGLANLGAFAGFGYLVANSRPAHSSASIGARLCRN